MDLSFTVKTNLFLNETKAFSLGKASHAYLLEGENGVGKHSFAMAMACMHFCTDEHKPCFNCAQCKKVLAGNHPDVHFFAPEASVFKVDTVREILSTVRETPYEGNVKIYIVEKFNLANDQAQNAFLKTLEEPPQNVLFFLLCENSLSMLPTVRSRCKKLYLKPWSQEDVFAFLQKNFAQNSNNQYIAAVSNGNIGKAIRLVDDEDFLKANEKAQKIVDAIKEGKNADKVFALLELEDDFLTLIEDKIHALFLLEPEKYLLRLKAISDAKSAKKINVNKTLIQQKLAYELVKGGKKWQK